MTLTQKDPPENLRSFAPDVLRYYRCIHFLVSGPADPDFSNLGTHTFGNRIPNLCKGTLNTYGGSKLLGSPAPGQITADQAPPGSQASVFRTVPYPPKVGGRLQKGGGGPFFRCGGGGHYKCIAPAGFI